MIAVGPLVCVIILAKADWIPSALSAPHGIYCAKFSRLSIIILNYFSAGEGTMVWLQTFPCVVATFFRLLISTLSVFSSAYSRPVASRYAFTPATPSFAIVYAWLICLATTMAIWSAKLIIVVSAANGNLSAPLYMLFHTRGPTTDSCETPAVVSWNSVPLPLSYVSPRPTGTLFVHIDGMSSGIYFVICFECWSFHCN